MHEAEHVLEGYVSVLRGQALMFTITKVQLIETERGEAEARPYHKASVNGLEGGFVEMHLAPNEMMELEIVGSEFDTIVVNPDDLDRAYARLVELSRG